VAVTVAHLTDFSEASAEAFLHALALALAYKHRLYLLRVKDLEREDSWSSFPHVREALARWGLVAADVARSEIEEKLGIQVAKVEIEGSDLAGGVFNFILSHRPDVFVLATHGREGLNWLLHGSKADEVARRTHVPAIFIGPQARGFVDKSNGQIRLERILFPVAHSPSPIYSYRFVSDLLAPFGVSSASFHFMHVGDSAPKIVGVPYQSVEVVGGPTEQTILHIAQNYNADMIAMPTAGSSWIS
jgi:nucleotide-binding universal stress UspA family protein